MRRITRRRAFRIGSAWVYYGPQRTVVGDLPVWTPFTYVSFLFVIAVGVNALAARLPTRRRWLIIPAVPLLLAAGHLTTSLPGAIALYHSENPTLILAGALTSMAAAALLVQGLAISWERIDHFPVVSLPAVSGTAAAGSDPGQ